MGEKNRVLQVNLDGVGGAFSSAKSIQETIKNEYIFDYLSMGRFIDQIAKKNVQKIGGKVFELGLRKNRLWGHVVLPLKFFVFLKHNKYELVQINADTAWKSLLFVLPAQIAGVKIVIVFSHASGVNGDYFLIKKALHYFCKPILNGMNTRKVACSMEAAKWMFMRPEDTVIIRNGINIKDFLFDRKVRDIQRKKMDLIGKYVIGHVTDFSEAKNEDFLLSLFNDLLRVNSAFHLLIIGDGKRRIIYEEKVKEMNIKNFGTFCGYINDIRLLYNAMDLFLLPSINEGYPMCAVEAQVNGLKVLLSNQITKEVKISQRTDYLPIDAKKLWIDKIIDNIDIRDDRTSEQIDCSKADVEKTSKQIADLYKE